MNEIRWKQPIASIEHLHAGGVGYVSDYFDAEEFRRDVMESNDCGESICVVLYRDENGNRLLRSNKWMESIDCPAVHLREEAAPIVHDRNSTYEIYQIPATEDCADYLFLPYEWAKEQIEARDYVRVYAAPLEPGMTLGGIYDRHNRDDRPAAQTMRSLSASDLIVVRGRQGVQAFYVDRVGFREVPQLIPMLEWMRKREARNGHSARRPPDSGLER